MLCEYCECCVSVVRVLCEYSECCVSVVRVINQTKTSSVVDLQNLTNISSIETLYVSKQGVGRRSIVDMASACGTKGRGLEPPSFLFFFKFETRIYLLPLQWTYDSCRLSFFGTSLSSGILWNRFACLLMCDAQWMLK